MFGLHRESTKSPREKTVRQAGCTCSVGPVPRCSSTLKALLSSGAFLYFSVFATMAHLNRAPYRAGYDYSNPNSPQLFPVESTGWGNPPWTTLYVCVIRFASMRVYALTDFVHRRRTRLRLNQRTPLLTRRHFQPSLLAAAHGTFRICSRVRPSRSY